MFINPSDAELSVGTAAVKSMNAVVMGKSNHKSALK